MWLSRESALLATLTGEPASTSGIYDRVGYAPLTRVGLTSHDAFRAAEETGETSATDPTPEA